jgi:hypothetical protein
MKKILALASVLLLAASLSFAQGTPTATTTLNLTVGAEAGIVMGTTTAFTSTPPFGNYLATTGLTYFIRTSSGGSGAISLQVTSDFGPSGGPSVLTPPTPGDALTYTSTVAQPGAGGSSVSVTTPLTASTTLATNVATFTSNSQSLKAGNSASVSWDLTNDPLYLAKAYSATVTFTISAS